MGKNIFAAIVGYVAIFVMIFVLFSIAFLILGVERSYQPGTFHVSTLWIIVSLILSFPVAVVGGYVCKLIARNDTAVKILMGIAFVLGLVMASGSLFVEATEVARPDDVAVMEAMWSSLQPMWVGFVVALIHVAGVPYGGGLKKTTPQASTASG